MEIHRNLIVRLSIWWICLVAFAYANCRPEICGSINVTYPFWINNSSCGYPGFQIKCLENNSSGKPQLFLPASVNDSETNFEILKMNYTGHLIINSTSLKAEVCDRKEKAVFFKLRENGPFTISSFNKFVVVGCNSSGSFNYRTQKGVWNDGKCKAACLRQVDPVYCNLHACCEAGIPGNWTWINFDGGGMDEKGEGTCGFSTILDPSTYNVSENAKGVIGRGHYGLRLEWDLGHFNCSTAKETSNYACDPDAECFDSGKLPSITGAGHVCKCPPGYEGNGYSNGTICRDVDECRDPELNECVDPPHGKCHNLAGTYNCSCEDGYTGNGFQNGTRCQRISSNNIVISAIIGSVTSFVVFALATLGLLWWLKKRHLKLLKTKYFQHNGGIQLQQYIASKGGRESLRIFSAEELGKASNNYSNDMKLGSGGYGAVYKGILLDGTPVAIKKSNKISDPQEDYQFINEVIILSQINHRNIVKLLGCCLETQFPLLVYELVSNGTLYEHLHSEEKILTWEARIRIAMQVAEALAYLHSEASQPIFHRDIKSSNILLDKTFTAKVADFGISRILSADDTHVITNVMGTRGYLDPEYFQTSQLTDKSDVYSFGVVLVELLTGLVPLSLDRTWDECILSNLLLLRMNDSRLTEILDSKVMKEENQTQMENIAKLARECLAEEGRKRPSMKEVVQELVLISRSATGHPRSYTSVMFLETASVSQFEQRPNSIEASQYYSFPLTTDNTSEELSMLTYDAR